MDAGIFFFFGLSGCGNICTESQTSQVPKISPTVEMAVCFSGTLNPAGEIDALSARPHRNETTANTFKFHTCQDKVNKGCLIVFLMIVIFSFNCSSDARCTRWLLLEIPTGPNSPGDGAAQPLVGLDLGSCNKTKSSTRIRSLCKVHEDGRRRSLVSGMERAVLQGDSELDPHFH